MKPGEFAELFFDIPICAELKQHIDTLYSLYKKDPENFKIHCCQQIRGGLTKLDILTLLPFMFNELKSQEENKGGSK